MTLAHAVALIWFVLALVNLWFFTRTRSLAIGIRAISSLAIGAGFMFDHKFAIITSTMILVGLGGLAIAFLLGPKRSYVRQRPPRTVR